MHQQVYHSQQIQAWERRWFEQQNSSYGLMQQVAWSIAQRLHEQFQLLNIKKIAVWCGAGNNAGDGYCIATYLSQWGYRIAVFATELGTSKDLHAAYETALQNQVNIHKINLSNDQFDHHLDQQFDCHIDALFGIGLNRDLDENWQRIIQCVNRQDGLKVAIDIPSGLNANTGQTLPICIKADFTFTVLALKAGLFTGKGKEYAGKVSVVSLIPNDNELSPIAKLAPENVHLAKRAAYGHKGSYGHVLVVGGHAEMGGAVMMSAEAAFASGAGKVTVVCDAKHHQAILSRAPNIMLRDINLLEKQEIEALLDHVDAVCFGMGLGRDDWAESQYHQWYPLIRQAKNLEIVLDADALWFLALNPELLDSHYYLTPHPGEAAKLLDCSIGEIENNRIDSIHLLREKYQGQWVLKGSGSLTYDDELWICTVGNAGMGTGGMGDVLAGMIASLKAQLHTEISLHDIVTLHAQAGDVLAKSGQRGLQAHHMNSAIYQVVN
ncbi:NAD(P)H-hydrate dehydratase [Acinetobacter gerneri]|uniref:Bifunctional NAD(P)H-hydrate repair enzyme n=1 Tax=Acinetobacter gerneri TaxID=202952 RepID=A0AAW8JFJ9_9GAMM|nr:NAD(P)H-hydrate dehydratase [Acinetobacter gerneri]MDQ9008171.1 NAD(P)H-hydrate dehydratase [Acinetobacter gerneri]MDQ9012415.1 NAD(P)H-hydrate dehydratase [Acinetobacter gerneri]MDQ9023710.1 NAD(P)H-hydrate dehydratase [Acinetobacter gerneri]MDQ9051328.1 NAD(P)H-hydrate dehydratase [Acinetobacter gerneri]MDQ9058813.1 NAD(P)H-hydrate dehydratase [Acinetobacter gerneri]